MPVLKGFALPISRELPPISSAPMSLSVAEFSDLLCSEIYEDCGFLVNPLPPPLIRYSAVISSLNCKDLPPDTYPKVYGDCIFPPTVFATAVCRVPSFVDTDSEVAVVVFWLSLIHI